MSDLTPLALREFHQSLAAELGSLGGAEIVTSYGDVASEYFALRDVAGVLDLSFRGRLCLTGADRVRFLHGQVTNDVKRLAVNTGCYAALTNAKGRMQSDLNILALQDELLLDFEPGLAATIVARLEKYIVADDVQVVDASPHYGLLSVQGPKSEAVVRSTQFFSTLPEATLSVVRVVDATLGELYLVKHPRLGSAGFDLYVPIAGMAACADKLIAAAKLVSGRACGWQAFETARIECGIPRYGMDMDESHLASECGIEARAISYQKGCYIGQEVLNRIHSIGHVNRELRRLKFPRGFQRSISKGEKIFAVTKEVGYVTSAVVPPSAGEGVGLGFVNRDFYAPGTSLLLRMAGEEIPVVVQ